MRGSQWREVDVNECEQPCDRRPALLRIPSLIRFGTDALIKPSVFLVIQFEIDLIPYQFSGFFVLLNIQNQITPSPHDGLPYEESARIIINHVAHGLELADKYHLPESIKQFIRTHHGQSKAKYFYNSYANEHPGEEFDPAPFTYAGPKPTTKETALLMMADGVEAASRSLTVYTSETIGNLVSRIIDSQMADGAFAECPITFSDIAKVKQVFTEKIASIYHPRTSYPELRNK